MTGIDKFVVIPTKWPKPKSKDENETRMMIRGDKDRGGRDRGEKDRGDIGRGDKGRRDIYRKRRQTPENGTPEKRKRTPKFKNGERRFGEFLPRFLLKRSD